MGDEVDVGGGAGAGGDVGGGVSATADTGGGERPSWLPEGYDSPEAMAKEFEEYRKFGDARQLQNYKQVFDHFNTLADDPDMGDVVKSLYSQRRMPDGWTRAQQQQAQRQQQEQAKRERYKYFDPDSHPEARQRFFEETIGTDPGQLIIQGAKNDPDVQDAIWQIVSERLSQSPLMGQMHQAAFMHQHGQTVQSLHPAARNWLQRAGMSDQNLQMARYLSEDISRSGGAPPNQAPPGTAQQQAQQSQQAERYAAGRSGAGGSPGQRSAPKKGDKASRYLS